jgi:hypothetical protein
MCTNPKPIIDFAGQHLHHLRGPIVFLGDLDLAIADFASTPNHHHLPAHNFEFSWSNSRFEPLVPRGRTSKVRLCNDGLRDDEMAVEPAAELGAENRRNPPAAPDQRNDA